MNFNQLASCLALRNVLVLIVCVFHATAFGSAAAAKGEQAFTTPRGEAQNVRFEQAGAGIVNIFYDLVASDPRAVFEVVLEASQDTGATWGMRPQSVTGDVGAGVRPGTGKRIAWESGKDVERVQIDRFRFRIVATAGPLTVDVAPVPAPGPSSKPVASAPPPSSPAAPTAKKGGNGKLIGIIGGLGAAGAVAALAGGGSGGGKGVSSTPPTAPTTPTTATPTPNRPPTIQGIAVSPSDKVGLDSTTEFAFTPSGASDPDNDSLTYDWDFGDGSAHSSAPNPTKVYTRSGVFDVRLSVSDGRGGAASAVNSGIRISNMNGTWDVVVVANPAYRFPLTTRFTLTLVQQGNALSGNSSWVDPCGRSRTQAARGTLTGARQVFVGMESWNGVEVGCGTGGNDFYVRGSLDANLITISGGCVYCEYYSTFSMTRR